MIITVGNIGSGKSTYVKKYQKLGYVVISKDQLRYAIGGGQYIFNLIYEDIIWETELEMLRKFMSKSVNIVVDGTGVSKNIRKRYIQIGKMYGYKITVIEMPRFGMGESITRRMINNHGNTSEDVWKLVWTRFEAIYEEPCKKEGIDKIIKIDKKEVS